MNKLETLEFDAVASLSRSSISSLLIFFGPVASCVSSSILSKLSFLKAVASPRPGGGSPISSGTFKILSSPKNDSSIGLWDVEYGTEVVVVDTIIGAEVLDVLRA